MTLALNSAVSPYFKDSGVPLASYTAQSVVIEQGQLILNTANGDVYVCSDASNQAALVWQKMPNQTQVAAYQSQADWAQASSGDPSFVKNKPAARAQSSASRSLNTGFQLSTTRDSLVNYSVDIAATISLTTGQTGAVFLEIASDSGFTTNVQELARFVNGNSGTLTVDLNLTQTITGGLGGYVPAAYYCRLRTANTVGTPTFTFRSGQEVLL